MRYDGASESVFALVAGLPPGPRERRQIMALQAYIDESGNTEQDKIYVLGGFIASAVQWAEFSAKWEKALEADPQAGTPKLDYFKHSEAVSLTGQFYGWTEQKRDNKMVDLCRIICAHRKYFIYTAIRHRLFNEMIRSVPAPVRTLGTDTPYLTLYFQIITNLAILAERYNEREKVDFIFDEQGAVAKEADEHWAIIPRVYSKVTEQAGKPNILGSRPIFRDEKRFLPLQAADFLVGQIRANLAKSEIIRIPPSPYLLSMTIEPGWGFESKPENIASLGDQLRADMLEYFGKNEDVLPQFYSPHATPRQRRKGRNRMLRQKKFSEDDKGS